MSEKYPGKTIIIYYNGGSFLSFMFRPPANCSPFEISTRVKKFFYPSEIGKFLIRKMDSYNLLSNFWCKKLFSQFFPCQSFGALPFNFSPLFVRPLLSRRIWQSWCFRNWIAVFPKYTKVMFNLTRDYSSLNVFLPFLFRVKSYTLSEPCIRE
jgi:hypothetical protein